MSAKTSILWGCVFAFLSVALGAFGAHALKERFSDYAMSVYQTGVTYQATHALALIGLGLWALITQQKAGLPAVFFAVGIVLFSGSLYVIAFSGVRAFGAVTPFGGVLFLAGWALWAWSVYRS